MSFQQDLPTSRKTSHCNNVRTTNTFSSDSSKQGYRDLVGRSSRLAQTIERVSNGYGRMPRYAQSRDLLESLRRFRDIIGNIQRSVDVLATIIEQTEDDMEPTLQGDAQLDVVEQDWASSDIVAYWFGPSEGGGGRIGVPEGVAQAQSGERSGITLSVPEHDLALRDVTSPHTSMDTSNSPRARIARNPTLAEAAHPLRQGTAGDPKLRLGYDYVDSYRERADDGWEIANRLDGLGGCLR